MNFKFEDYYVDELKVVQAKLYQLFPKGSSVSEFQSAMEQLGAKCYTVTVDNPREGEFDDDVITVSIGLNPGSL